MNQELAIELQFFAICILWGGLILLAYDFLRVIRRLIKHGTVLLAAEDLIFWVISAVLIFAMIYRQNNGVIRAFSIMGMTAGMLLYNMTVKDHLVNIIVKGIRILIKPFVLLIKLLKKRIVIINKKIQNALKILLKQLNLLYKSIKIRVGKKQQKRLQKRLKRKEERSKRLDEKASKKQAKKSAIKAKKKAENKAAKGDAGTALKGNGKPVKSDKGESRHQFQTHRSEQKFTRLSEEELRQILSRR